MVIAKSDKGEEKMAPEEASGKNDKATEEKEEDKKKVAEEGGDAKEDFDDDDLTDDEQSFTVLARFVNIQKQMEIKLSNELNKYWIDKFHSLN